MRSFSSRAYPAAKWGSGFLSAKRNLSSRGTFKGWFLLPSGLVQFGPLGSTASAQRMGPRPIPPRHRDAAQDVSRYASRIVLPDVMSKMRKRVLLVGLPARRNARSDMTIVPAVLFARGRARFDTARTASSVQSRGIGTRAHFCSRAETRASITALPGQALFGAAAMPTGLAVSLASLATFFRMKLPL